MKLFGLIGDPVGHSMSPAMHNDAFQSLGFQGYYHAFPVAAANLEAAVAGLNILGFSGFNVTIPHKTAIMPFLDDIDPLARAIGAVNTVVRENGGFTGYNTDGPGFVRALEEELDIAPSGERALLIGAGGAARGIYYSLVAAGCRRVDVCNRTPSKALNMIKGRPSGCETAVLSLEEAERQLEAYTLIIQTTSIGMHPNVGEQPLELDRLKVGAAVCDIIYNPLETAFLQQAKEMGARTQNGVGMFVYQGALAFEKWTGSRPDIGRMKQIVTKQLGGITC